MQINNYEEIQKIRIRDQILKDDEIRNAAIKVVNNICNIKNMQYNEKTGSISFYYDKETLPLEKLKSLIPLARKLQSKITFYTQNKKDEILSEIEKINKIIMHW